MEQLGDLTTGGIFAVLVIKLVLDHLEKSKAKKAGEHTSFFSRSSLPFNGETKKIQQDISEIHDVLLAQPPRQSVVSTLTQVDEALRNQVQQQREAVRVLEDIRDELRSHGPKLDKAECKKKSDSET